MSVEEARQKYLRIGQAASGRKSAFGSLAYIFDGYAFALRRPSTILKERAFGKQVMDFSSHYAPFIAAVRQHDVLKHKRVLVFHVNSHAAPYSGFPVGRDPQFPHVEFIDLGLGRADCYRVDDHLTPRATGRPAGGCLRLCALCRGPSLAR